MTGASGFVGQALMADLLAQHYSVRVAMRRPSNSLPEVDNQFVVGELSSAVDWSLALNSVDTVIHCAARVHIMNDSVAEPLAAFREVNTVATLGLAKAATKAGVRRFVYLSSVKVNGEGTADFHPHPSHSPGGVNTVFTEMDDFIPVDPYGLSKYEAEQGLLAIAKESGMEVVIIRPPLVYGPGVRANFASMMKWMNKGVPLPFGAIHNQRSLVALENLVSFIIHCIDHPKAANEVFLISDGEDVSTTELLQKVAKAFGKKPLLLPVPVGLMMFIAKLLGKGSMASRLFGSLQVDSSKARELLGWKAVIKMDDQLKKIAEAYEKSL